MHPAQRSPLYLGRYKSRSELESEGLGHLPDQLVSELEQAWGVSFPEGYTRDLPFMSHLWQEIRCHYRWVALAARTLLCQKPLLTRRNSLSSFRPMCFYLGIEIVYLVKHLLMLGAGFKAGSHCGYNYYTRGLNSSQSESSNEQNSPILFIHGVGLGLLPYITFLLRLAATDHPVIAVESSHLGMRWVENIPSEDEVVDVIVEILNRLELQSTAVVAHSYGTFMASRLVQRLPHRVQSLVLIDPVCFIMFDGEILGLQVANILPADVFI